MQFRHAAARLLADDAKANGYVIVTKDMDFQQRSLLYGHPPKVCAAACRKLHGENNRRFIAAIFCRYSQIRVGHKEVLFSVTVVSVGETEQVHWT